jgi:hypothetical protein
LLRVSTRGKSEASRLTDTTAPLAEIDTAPQALAVDQNVLLTADGIDRLL